MKRMKLEVMGMAVLLLVVGIACAMVPPAGTVLYIAPDGDDANPGTKKKPFATFVKARDAVRQLKADGSIAKGATVAVRKGVYRFADTFTLSDLDSGFSPEYPVKWIAERGTKVLGSVVIPPGKMRQVTERETLDRLSEEAKGHVLWLDLQEVIGRKVARPGPSFRMPFNLPELYCDGRRESLSVWPNEGWALIEKIIDTGTVRNTGYVSDSADPNKKRSDERRGGTFRYAEDRPARWNTAKWVWLHGYWCFDWFDDVLRVAKIDTSAKEITFEAPHVYGVRQGNPSPRRWRALNLLEEIDRPGEFYVDAESGRLYFWPSGDPQKSEFTLTALDGSLLALKNVENVVFRGFVFSENQGDCLTITDCKNIAIEGCELKNIRKRAIYMTGSSHCTILACDLHDLGTGGINLGGGDRKTLAAAGNLIENCRIREFAVHQRTSVQAIHFEGVGSTARRNLICDGPHTAVSFSGNDHVFEYNIVSNVCNASDDAGALYKGRNPSCRGTVIRYNLFEDIGAERGHGTAAIYFDDGDGGDSVIGNIFYKCGDPGKGSFGTVFSHGGHGNLAQNNLFIDCKRPLGSAPWSDKRWKDFINAPLWQTRLLKEVDITRPPYTTRYPELVGFMDPQPNAPRDNVSKDNVFYRCGEVKSGRWITNATDFVTSEDIGIVDLAGRDFRLKKNSIVYKHNPGFSPIPVEQIGPYPVSIGIRRE